MLYGGAYAALYSSSRGRAAFAHLKINAGMPPAAKVRSIRCTTPVVVVVNGAPYGCGHERQNDHMGRTSRSLARKWADIKGILCSGARLKNQERGEPTKSIADTIAESTGAEYVPVTFESCDHVEGPFFHGTKTAFQAGDRLVPGSLSNYHQGRISKHVYFSALLEPAVWAAELTVALARSEELGRIYVVEPTGPFEDDPNVTDKKFPGNVTRSYRTRHPMRVVSEVETWDGHAPEVLQGMLDNIARLREQGLDIIED